MPRRTDAIDDRLPSTNPPSTNQLLQLSFPLKKMLSTIPPTLCSHSPKNPHPSPSSSPPQIPTNPHPSLLIRFPTSHKQNLRYLNSLSITLPKFTSPHKTSQLLSLITHLKSYSFSDSDIPTLSHHIPTLFNSNLDDNNTNNNQIFHQIGSVFNFLTLDLRLSQEESRKLILICPRILLCNVDVCLKPSFIFLKELGIRDLCKVSVLNANLLNTRVEKFREKIRFLESLGLREEEARRVCGRFPAIFGYSIENNLRLKVDYLRVGMGRSVEELKEFPQFLGFSLEKRIVPRYLYLKERNLNVKVSLRKMWC